MEPAAPYKIRIKFHKLLVMPPQASGSIPTPAESQALAAKIDEYSRLLTKTDRIIHNRHTDLPTIDREYKGLLASAPESFFGDDYEQIKTHPNAQEPLQWIDLLRNEVLHNAQTRLVNAQVAAQFRYASAFPERRQHPEAHIGIEGAPYETAIRWPGFTERIQNANGLPAYAAPDQGLRDADIEHQIGQYRELLETAGKIIDNTNNRQASSYEAIEKAYLTLLASPPEDRIGVILIPYNELKEDPLYQGRLEWFERYLTEKLGSAMSDLINNQIHQFCHFLIAKRNDLNHQKLSPETIREELEARSIEDVIGLKGVSFEAFGGSPEFDKRIENLRAIKSHLLEQVNTRILSMATPIEAGVSKSEPASPEENIPAEEISRRDAAKLLHRLRRESRHAEARAFGESFMETDRAQDPVATALMRLGERLDERLKQEGVSVDRINQLGRLGEGLSEADDIETDAQFATYTEATNLVADYQKKQPPEYWYETGIGRKQ
jgi:hypothetical protein